MSSKERRITQAQLYKSGHGTHYYKVKYEGEWEDIELITAIDNRTYENPTYEELSRISHYGGYVQKLNKGEALVEVYYD